MELFKAISARHSIRSFKDEPVPRELVDKVIEAAAMAPSAMNEQSWRFYVLQGESRNVLGRIMVQGTSYLEEYMEVIGHEVSEQALHWYSELGGAPVAILCTMGRTEDEFIRQDRLISIGGAIENMLLAVTDIGLASCTISFSYWVREELAEAIGVSEDREIVSIVVLGYPGAPPVAPQHNMDVVEYLD